MLSKMLTADETFKGLSSDANILHSRLLNRTNLTYKNKWIDEKNKMCII
ncbi:MAG: replication initiator protein A [Eubacteriales bacterium]|nr:replication initiator protein A [Eubacteriales bacterium]